MESYLFSTKTVWYNISIVLFSWTTTLAKDVMSNIRFAVVDTKDRRKISSIFNLMFDCFSFNYLPYLCLYHFVRTTFPLSKYPIKVNCPIILFYHLRSIMAPNWLDGNWQVWLKQRYNQKLKAKERCKRKEVLCVSTRYVPVYNSNFKVVCYQSHIVIIYFRFNLFLWKNTHYKNF